MIVLAGLGSFVSAVAAVIARANHEADDREVIHPTPSVEPFQPIPTSGAQTTKSSATCQNCQAINREGATFCQRCHEPLSGPIS
jgi:uncharacterized paraquat-inducible protein A